MNENPEIENLFRGVYQTIKTSPDTKSQLLHLLMQAMSFENAFHCLANELPSLQNKSSSDLSCVPLFDPLM